MSDPRHEPKPMHQLRNHLAVVITFAELLLEELPADDPHRADVLEIHKAGTAAIHLIPDLITPA
jgi:hypothetical protein